MLLPFSAGRLRILGLPVAGLIALSVAVNPQAWLDAAWWVYACLGGFFLLIVAMPLVLEKRSWLRLDKQGMELRMLFGSQRFAWREIEGFQVVRQSYEGAVPLTRTVGITFKGKPPGIPAALAWILKTGNGYHRSIPAWFGGLDAAELCRVLEEYRRDSTTA